MVSFRYFIFLVPVILISGCVLPTWNPFDSNTPAGAGVVIENFGPDFTEVYSGEPVRFTLNVKNTGSVKAENGFAELLGIDQTWGDPGSPLYNESTREMFPNEMRCRYTVKDITLLPEDPESGVTGGEETCTWDYIAPPVYTGGSNSYTAKARFFYSYSSSAIKTITMVPREEIKVIQNQGGSLPADTHSSTNSPVVFSIETGSPIRTYADKVEFPIVITAKNAGGGTVCSSINHCKALGGREWYRVNFDMSLPAGLSFAPGSACADEKERIFMLMGPKEQSMSCKIIADTSQQMGASQKNIEINADYGYFVEKSADIVVYASNVPGKE